MKIYQICRCISTLIQIVIIIFGIYKRFFLRSSETIAVLQHNTLKTETNQTVSQDTNGPRSAVCMHGLADGQTDRRILYGSAGFARRAIKTCICGSISFCMNRPDGNQISSMVRFCLFSTFLLEDPTLNWNTLSPGTPLVHQTTSQDPDEDPSRYSNEAPSLQLGAC